MRLLFWNVGGLGTTHRRKFIRNHILQDNIDVVLIQETIKSTFESSELREMEGIKEFQWIWSPRGHSGGLLTGMDPELLELEYTKWGYYTLNTLVRVRSSNFRFWISNVYGPANHELSDDFIREISEFCSEINLPIILGGILI